MANHQPVVVGDYLCCLARPCPGMVITSASVATSGVRDPTEKHLTDTSSEDRSLAQGKQCTLKALIRVHPISIAVFRAEV